MRVLFIGPTGVNLQLAVRKLADHCRVNVCKLEEGQLKSIGDKVIFACFLEEYLPDLHAYLDIDNQTQKQEMWEKAFNETLTKINQNQADHYFLGLHLPHYRNNKFFPIPTLEKINQYSEQ